MFTTTVRQISLTVNGAPAEAHAGDTVRSLLEQLSLNPAKVAVERNRAIVPRSAYAETALAEGDEIEIVTFVGGG
jgi:thiamine biosynthesis protein ThiS